MEKSEVKKKYLKKIKEIKKHNILNYQKSNPLISNSDYDKLKKDIIELERKYNYLNSKFFH